MLRRVLTILRWIEKMFSGSVYKFPHNVHETRPLLALCLQPHPVFQCFRTVGSPIAAATEAFSKVASSAFCKVASCCEPTSTFSIR